MTGKVFIFLGIILTLFHVLLFYKKYLEIPEESNFDTRQMPYSITD